MVRFQKLTRNLFLTLHGQNVHRQQRQLSKFLMRYQQFASHAYCGAAGPVSKMASQQEKAFCVATPFAGSNTLRFLSFVKDSVYVPPLPMSLKELHDRITHALQTIIADMLHRVWDEFDYHVGVCRVTQGAHTEGL